MAKKRSPATDSSDSEDGGDNDKAGGLSPGFVASLSHKPGGPRRPLPGWARGVPAEPTEPVDGNGADDAGKAEVSPAEKSVEPAEVELEIEEEEPAKPVVPAKPASPAMPKTPAKAVAVKAAAKPPTSTITQEMVDAMIQKLVKEGKLTKEMAPNAFTAFTAAEALFNLANTLGLKLEEGERTTHYCARIQEAVKVEMSPAGLIINLGRKLGLKRSTNETLDKFCERLESTVLRTDRLLREAKTKLEEVRAKSGEVEAPEEAPVKPPKPKAKEVSKTAKAEEGTPEAAPKKEAEPKSLITLAMRALFG